MALFDYDNDGDLDVYLVQGPRAGSKREHRRQSRVGEELPLPDRLYRNDLSMGPDGSRTLRFTDVTRASGIDAPGYGMGVAAGDFDNDGWIDLYLTKFDAPNQLLRNNGNGTFTDVSTHERHRPSSWSVSAAFVDYRSRRLARPLRRPTTCATRSRTTRRCFEPRRALDYCTPDSLPGHCRTACTATAQRHVRRRQRDGAGVARERARRSASRPPTSTATAGSTSTSPTTARRTSCGSTSATARSRTPRCCPASALPVDGKAEASMGVDAGDFDNDGDDDLFMTELTGEGSNLYVNDGAGVFEDRGAPSGLGPLERCRYTGFGTAWFDFDNDGWLDLLAVNGAVQAIETLRQARRSLPAAPAQAALPQPGRRPLRGRQRAGGAGLRAVRGRPRRRVWRHRQRRRHGRRHRQQQRSDAPARQSRRQPQHWLGLRLVGHAAAATCWARA